jgi:hypothetical protein
MIKPGQHTGWTKSSYSVETTNCVEVRSPDSTIDVSDSKLTHADDRPHFSVSLDAFSAFVQHVGA